MEIGKTSFKNGKYSLSSRYKIFTGIQHVAPVDEMPLEKWNDLIQVNLTTPFILSKHVVPAMKMKGMTVWNSTHVLLLTLKLMKLPSIR